MKRVVVGICLVLAMVVVASLKPCGAEEARAGEQAANNHSQVPSKNWAAGNPLKIALLKWYPANQTTSFVVGKTQNSNPYGIAFDGENIWTANSGENTVTKLRASDGTNLGTFHTGNLPTGVTFDGANVWVSNSSDNTVTKLRASDGKNLGTFNVGKYPFWMVFDGEALWVANFSEGTVTKLRTSDGKTLGKFNTGGAIALAFDGTYIWVSTWANEVVRLKKDGSNAGSFKVGGQPLGIAFDGANIWAASNTGGYVTKLRASDGTILGQFQLEGSSPYGVAFDGNNVWVTVGIAVAELRASDGKVLGYFNANGGSTGLAFDGANVWVALGLGNVVLKF